MVKTDLPRGDGGGCYDCDEVGFLHREYRVDDHGLMKVKAAFLWCYVFYASARTPHQTE